MKKIIIATTLSAHITLSIAGGVPTFDGVDIGVSLKNFAELTKTVQKLKQQYDTQLNQYKNQFGDTFGILDEIQNLELYKTDFGYLPADPQKAVALLVTLGEHSNPEVAQTVNKILSELNNINIKDAVTAANHKVKNEQITANLELYMNQMVAAQERIKNVQGLMEQLANSDTQKEREAITAQIGAENYRATSEVANILATKNAKEALEETMKQRIKVVEDQNWDKFINGSKGE